MANITVTRMQIMSPTMAAHKEEDEEGEEEVAKPSPAQPQEEEKNSPSAATLVVSNECHSGVAAHVIQG